MAGKPMPPPPPYHQGIPPPPSHPGDTKRKAPISAGAFAFDLSKVGTPQKKPRTVISGSNELQTPSRQSKTPASRSATTARTPQPKIPAAALSAHALPAVNPLKQVKPLGTLRSPFVAATPSRAQTTQDVKHKPLQSILDDTSPFVSRPYKPSAAPKEGEKLVRLGELTAGKIDDAPRERAKREDEGVGVSPRKPRAIKWNGKGDMPTSIHLAQVLHTANSSLVLFYNSLQRILHPPARPVKPSFGGKYTSPDRTPTAVQQIRTAHVRLHPTSPSWSRTHNGIVFKCDVVKRKHPAGETTLAAEEDHVETPGAEGGTAMLVLQPVPHECAHLGVDPKVVVGKMQEGAEKRWEIGVWAPYEEMDLRPGPRRNDGAEDAESSQRDHGETAHLEKTSTTQTTRILFASRYLIAEI